MSMELVSKQLVLSGKLKPEARLGFAISEFTKNLDSNLSKEFRSMQNAQDARVSNRDIIKMTEEINQQGARRHRSWRPHGTKVGGFLSRIQTFATIGDVLVGGSQNLIATGIWSAVRLSLTAATNYLSYFEKLSTLFMRLGTSWALHEDFAQLFPTSAELQTYFCEYLVVLVKLCSKIIVWCQKSTGAQLLSSLGSSFDSEFGPIQKELDQWGCLIQQQTQLLATKIATDSQSGRFQDVKQRLLRSLSPYQNDFETRWRRQRKKGSCEWIFDTPSFGDWKSMQTSATLCIDGRLGSGKTVSMANIVARMSLDHPCTYVFCVSQEPTSLVATNILGSIAFNLVENLPAEARAWKNVEDRLINKTFFPNSIVEFLLHLLPADRRYIIIADGLENCSDADIDDVFIGLRRLIESRVVLFCYSCRSDSRFQHFAKQRFRPDFSVTHDGFNHEADMNAYIVKEVTRRNKTRHLNHDLEELVKEQLIAGAQGMYLWVSLQLDTIFPTNPEVVITDDQILNLITHLPRDLPEAFEQALQRIPDRQFEGRIMKLVMSAVTPLDIDEIRVALCVVVGEPVWHPERIAKDSRLLISLCGGSLLESDEEDGKVRFIHHSVIQHLLSPAACPSTTLYHFTDEDAENFIGAICVTYLHFTISDSRITVTKNLDSLEVLDNVMESTRQSTPVVSRLVHHIRAWEHKRARPAQIDIGHILSQLQAVPLQEELDPLCFAPYSTSHWVFHTRFFDHEVQDCKKSWSLWWRLLQDGVATVKSPCPDLEEKPIKTLLWAVEHGHGSLFRVVLAQGRLLRDQIAEVVRALELRKSIHGQWLGDILAQHLQSLNPTSMPCSANRITFLLGAGANPRTRHSTWGTSPIETLTHRICTDPWLPEDEQTLIHDFFSHPAVGKSLDDRSLHSALERFLEEGRRAAIAEVLACRPDLKLAFHQIQLKALSGRSAIERALDEGKWEVVEDLSNLNGQFGVNTPTFLGTSLLWKAIETKNDRWVNRLLRLGADPNMGPFKMTVEMESPSFMATCFPLEAALWLRRTRVCLELLHHGARTFQLEESLMRIAEETENSIMIAKLHEIPGSSQQPREACRRRRHECGRTALVAACKLLSHSGSCESRSVPKTLVNPHSTEDWMSGLPEIICRLARDASEKYVNSQDVDGKTALHYLSETKHTAYGAPNDPVKYILNRGADPNLPDCHGDTPLWLAIRHSAPIDGVIKPFLQAGANTNAARQSHSLPIIKGAIYAYQGTKQEVFRLVKLLLQFGADPRDPLRIESPEPSLISLAMEKGMQSLIGDFKEYTERLNGWSMDYESDTNLEE